MRPTRLLLTMTLADNEAYATLNGPVRGPNAANGWVCVSGGVESEIDFRRACRDTYGCDTVAHPDNDDDAYSWGCYRPRLDGSNRAIMTSLVIMAGSSRSTTGR